MKMSNSWGLTSIWNASLDVDNHREYVARDYCYASELGGSYYERYWKMKGRVPTTPPNLRSRRKFQGGNLTEWIVLQILARAGVLKSSQEYITYEDGPIRVTGRADFTAGGDIQLLSESDLQTLPESFADAAEEIIKKLQELHPEGLREVNIEVKSCSGIMFERYELAPSPQHTLQAFHYAYNTNRPTLLIYVSRDDFRICEWPILSKNEKYLKLYQEDIKKMAHIIDIKEDDVSEYIYQGKPVKEQLLVWNAGKFSSNWKIEYSNYLTDYGFEYPEQYGKPAKSFALRLTNVAKKIKEGKELTKINYKTLKEGVEFFPEASDIFAKMGVDMNLINEQEKVEV